MSEQLKQISELELLGDLIEGCLQEEGYIVKEYAHASASKFIAVRDRDNNKYTVSIFVRSIK